MERVFGLRARGSTARTEALAGATTFLTMAYILAVNPQILAQAGIDPGAAFVATCLSAAIGSALMGLLANLPIALARAWG
jgi:AGZA family xanthine/uracil permease-like MFS transporter